MAGNGRAPRVGREGSRWWNQRPTSDEVAEWFVSVPLHEGMEHDRYIGGIVLIEQKLKVDEVRGFADDGTPLIAEGVRHLTYTPYPKVETRVQYFQDLMAAHPEWMGVIEPVGGGTHGLGPGFSKHALPGWKDDKAFTVNFIACSMRVRVYERESYDERVVTKRDGTIEIVRTGKTIISGAPGTKMSAVNNRWGTVDEAVIMKAETGAVGRALGMAGMLTISGSGIATAEDMQEEGRIASGSGAGVSPAEAAALPPDGEAQETPEATTEAGIEQLRERVLALAGQLKEYPEAHQQFQEWAQGRKLVFAEADALALKGVIKKAEKDLAAAQEAAAEAATAEAVGEEGEE